MPADVGSQTITVLYYSPANSGIVNKRFQDIRQVGIYSGGYLTVVDGTHALLSTLISEISDGTYQVRLETGAAVNLVVGAATPYIVLRWTYSGAITDYAELLAVATPAAHDVVVGLCTFDGGGALNGFNYQAAYPRTTPSTKDLFLKVEATSDTELRVRIRAGKFQTSGAVVDISDQKSDLFVVPGSNSRVYLVYVTDAGAIAIDSTGTIAASPSPPAYDGKMVLAEVTLASTSTNIADSMIKDVRGFLSSKVVSDDVSIELNAEGKLQVKAYHGIQTFTINGTFTVPVGINQVKVICTGGGGHIIDGKTTGGSGATAIKWCLVTPGDNIVVTVGAINTIAGSSFGAFCTGGGAKNINPSPLKGVYDYWEGGDATGGDINIPGGDGGNDTDGSGGEESMGAAGYWGSAPGWGGGSAAHNKTVFVSGVAGVVVVEW